MVAPLVRHTSQVLFKSTPVPLVEALIMSIDDPSDLDILLDKELEAENSLKGRSTVPKESEKVDLSLSRRVRRHHQIDHCYRALKMVFSLLRKEAVGMFKLALPVVVTLLFQYSLLFISLIFIGHIPDEEEENNSLSYAAAGLGASFVNVTGLSVAQGFSTAVDTLCSQAFGYKNYKRMGVVLQRGVLTVGLLMFPIWVLWLNAETLLLLVQQEPCIARLSAFYTQLQTIALPFILLYVILQHYLNAQSIVWQFVAVGFLTNCISVILHAIMIYGAGLGYKGAVAALVISQCVPPLMVIIYVRVRKIHHLTWGGLSWQSLNEWVPFLKLAIPGMLMGCLEWWSAEAITFIAGSISKTELAATSVWFQIMVIIYMIPIGMSVATSVRVGNALGRGDPLGAKRTSFIAVGMAFCFAIVCSVTLLAARNHIGAVFISGDQEVVDRVSTLMYVAAAMILMDFMQVVTSGSLKGSGRQYIGAIMVFIGYYIIGLPLGALLGLKFELGAVGLWIGMACANFVHTGVLILVLFFSKWDKLSEKAMKMAQGNEPVAATMEQVEPVVEFEEPVELKPDEQLETDALSFEDEDMSTDEDILLSENSAVTQIEHNKMLERTKRLKWVLQKGSVFVLGVVLLIAGGVGSIFHPYVPQEQYSNCSDLAHDFNQSNNL